MPEMATANTTAKKRIFMMIVGLKGVLRIDEKIPRLEVECGKCTSAWSFYGSEILECGAASCLLSVSCLDDTHWLLNSRGIINEVHCRTSQSPIPYLPICLIVWVLSQFSPPFMSNEQSRCLLPLFHRDNAEVFSYRQPLLSHRNTKAYYTVQTSAFHLIHGPSFVIKLMWPG